MLEWIKIRNKVSWSSIKVLILKVINNEASKRSKIRRESEDVQEN